MIEWFRAFVCYYLFIGLFALVIDGTLKLGPVLGPITFMSGVVALGAYPFVALRFIRTGDIR